jgi:ADP-dependent glucokinase
MHTSTTIILIVLCISLIVGRYLQVTLSAGGPNTLLLRKLHAHFPSTQKCTKKIVLGWNTCIDLLVNASHVSEHLKLKPESSHAVDHENIPHLVALQESLSYWFSRGGAAERLMAGDKAESVFEKVVSSANNDPNGRLRVGGNAALMATSLAKFGCSVHLGGPVGPTLASRLDERIAFTSTQAVNEVIDPVHLILEYQKGQMLGDMVSPRANRYILVHDPLNAQLAGLEPLRNHLREHFENYDVFVASGLNQLEALSLSERSERLRAVRSAIYELPLTLPVHLELASMSDPKFVQQMAATMFPVANSFGLNEEELAFTFQSLNGIFSTDKLTVDMLTGKVPNVDAVVEALEFLLNKADEWTSAATSGGGHNVRKISRIHFHALSYHIIADRQVKGRELWATDLSQGAAAGSVIATLNACGKHPSYKTQHSLSFLFPNYPAEDELDLLYTDTCQDRDGVDQGVCVWTHNGITFSLAPVLVAKHPVNTVGLGDSISSSGLLYSL